MRASSAQDHLRDSHSRTHKARKILAILHNHLGDELSDLTCMDLGCCAGLISNVLAKEMEYVIGLDLDRAALSVARQHTEAENLDFALGTAERLPFRDAIFDVIVCAQVYEHVLDSDGMMAEVWRVLKDEGVCFFSGPNKLEFMEKHYHLPMLHWLPAPLANAYLRLMGKGTRYDVNPKTYWQLRSMLRKFQIVDYTAAMMRDPERYSCANEIPAGSWIRRIPGWVWKRLIWVLPNYNWILIKKGDK